MRFNLFKRKKMERKRFRYRKVTPEKLELMKNLREQGSSIKRIGEIVGISVSSVQYHLNPEEKRRSLERSEKYNSRMTEKQKREKSRKHVTSGYNRNYLRERYNNDPEFRERFLDIVKESQKRIRKERKKAGLCADCGGKREDEKYLSCKKCRKKKRRYYHKNIKSRKRYYQEHKEELQERTRVWKKKNKEHVKAYSRAYYLKRKSNSN